MLPKLFCTLKQPGCSGIIQTSKQKEVIAFMKPCPKCGEQIKKTLKFCVYCGCNIAQEEAKAKAKFCGECGAQLEDGMRFCGECGAKVDAPAKQNDDPWASVGQEAKCRYHNSRLPRRSNIRKKDIDCKKTNCKNKC